MKLTNAHGFGVNCLVWISHNDEANINVNKLSELRFASAGNDGVIKIWRANENNHGYDINSFNSSETLNGHEDTIRDIVWKYNSEQNSHVIISGGDVNTYLTI